MSKAEDNPVFQRHLQPNEQAVITREGWRVEFNDIVSHPCLSHDGQDYKIVDGVIVPSLDAQQSKIYDKEAILGTVNKLYEM